MRLLWHLDKLKPSRFIVSLYNKKSKNLAVLMEKAYYEMEVQDMLEEKYKEFKTNKSRISSNFNNKRCNNQQTRHKARVS